MSEKYNRKDFHHQEAKRKGYRSRAYFKLQEIDQKHHIFKSGMKVADLGAWPGGWLQYAAKKVGKTGQVIGIDLVEIEPLESDNVICIQGDLSDEACLAQVVEISDGRFDLVISDMSPKLTGIKVSDQAKSAAVGELAFYCAETLLKKNGNIVLKVFKSPDTDQLIRDYQKRFKKLSRMGLKSTRKTSNEFYLIGFGYLG